MHACTHAYINSYMYCLQKVSGLIEGGWCDSLMSNHVYNNGLILLVAEERGDIVGHAGLVVLSQGWLDRWLAGSLVRSRARSLAKKPMRPIGWATVGR